MLEKAKNIIIIVLFLIVLAYAGYNEIRNNIDRKETKQEIKEVKENIEGNNTQIEENENEILSISDKQIKNNETINHIITDANEQKRIAEERWRYIKKILFGEGD